MLTLRRPFVALLTLAVTLQPSQHADAVETHDTIERHNDAVVAPFAAHYTADWRSINVGTSDLELEADAVPGSYLYTWTVTARGLFRLMYSKDVVQKSWFSIHADHVVPEKYRADDGTSTASIDFDWQNKIARGESAKKPVDLKLSEGTQDIMSIQVEVMLDLQNGDLPKIFRILDKDEVKDFIYTQEGPARIRTALGELDTVVVASRRAGGDRLLRMWFAPSLQFVPVLAERSRGDTVEFTMKIKTLKRAQRNTSAGS